MMAISVLANAVFSGSFLVLISLTSPVLSSVAALLTIFLVAVTDFLIFGTPITFAEIFGGVLITGAFGLLAWSTWKEMSEEKQKRLENRGPHGEEEEADGLVVEEEDEESSSSGEDAERVD